jgi:hypothetical protein
MLAGWRLNGTTVTLSGCCPLCLGWRAGSLSCSQCVWPPSVLTSLALSLQICLGLFSNLFPCISCSHGLCPILCFLHSARLLPTQEIPDSRHGSPELFTLPTASILCVGKKISAFRTTCAQSFFLWLQSLLCGSSGITLLG